MPPLANSTATITFLGRGFYSLELFAEEAGDAELHISSARDLPEPPVTYARLPIIVGKTAKGDDDDDDDDDNFQTSKRIQLAGR